MTSFPSASALTGASVTQGGFKSALDQLLLATTERLVSGTTPILNDIISEATAGAGVTIDGVLLKDGGATFTLATKFAAGSVSAPGIYFGTDTNSGFYSIGNDNLGVATNGVKRIDISNTAVAFTVPINEAQGADIASATTTNIGAATGNLVNVTGTTTITGLGTVQAGTERTVIFTGILLLTHNATSLKLPGGANITTQAGDRAKFVSLGSGNWVCVLYTRNDGSNVAGGARVDIQTFNSSGTWTKPSGYSSDSLVTIKAWGGGGGGGGGSNAASAGSAGGGGAYAELRELLLSSMGATETVTVGAGGAAGTPTVHGGNGGNTTVGSLITAYGGGGGNSDNGPSANGKGGAGGNTFAAGINGGSSTGLAAFDGNSGGQATGSAGASNYLNGSGGGGGCTGTNGVAGVGGNSVYGGAGGGGGASGGTASAGGTSKFGGAGGAGGKAGAGTAGTAPGGGGGGGGGSGGNFNGGAGGAGRVIIYTYDLT